MRWTVFAAYASSTSHKATMFSDSRFRRLDAPLPPIPIPAIFIFSLGGISRGPPKTRRGTICTVAAAPAQSVEILTKARRFNGNGMTALL
jgi:hypothetical protein